jgi:TRAP-type uncharacterized transport system substrate-binding protein
MTDRKLTALVLLGVAGLVLPGHSPYLQWYAYRAKHLVVVADQARPGALELANAVASAVAARWPETKAIAAAARSSAEVVALLNSGQLQVGLLPAAAALEAVEGRVPLRAVASVGEEVLVVLESFAPDRAGAIAQALVETRGNGPFAAKPALRRTPIPLHPGAARYYRENIR